MCEGLIFLHNDAKILQGNLNPDSIAITTNGQWKIGGMFFSSAPVVMDGQVRDKDLKLTFERDLPRDDHALIRI